MIHGAVGDESSEPFFAATTVQHRRAKHQDRADGIGDRVPVDLGRNSAPVLERGLQLRCLGTLLVRYVLSDRAGGCLEVPANSLVPAIFHVVLVLVSPLSCCGVVI